MPAYGVQDTTTNLRTPAVHPTVEVNGETISWLQCIAVEDAMGGTPSKATFRAATPGFHSTQQVTLNGIKKWPFKNGTRVVVKDGGNVLFQGMFIRRSDQGAQNTLVWEAWSDLWLLQYIPVRGCLVRDPTAPSSLKFIDRYVTRFNPGGKWNCVGMTYNGGIYPVFTYCADLGRVYSRPSETFSDKLEDGTTTAWTPRRALMYLQLIASLESGAVPGANDPHWRSLQSSTRLQFTADSLNISARDIAQTFDPLDRKLPDLTVQGMSMLQALSSVLKSAGTHEIGLRYDGGEKSSVVFFPLQASQQANVERGTISLLRGGPIDDIDTAYDFEVDEDATHAPQAALVQGAPVHVEAEFFYDDADPSNSTIQKEWSAAEQTAFLTGIKGEVVSGTRYATYPITQGDTDTTKFVAADGASGRYYALAGSPEAIRLLRMSFPRVFRCFSFVNSVLYSSGILKGHGDIYDSATLYPYLSVPRPMLDAQLQFFTYGSDRILERIPVRVQIKDQVTLKYHDVTSSPGIYVAPDGRFYLDGLIENVDGQVDCIYYPALGAITGTSNLTLWDTNQFKINAAIPMDHRVTGYQSIVDEGVPEVLDSDLLTELGGPPLLYIDSPDGYREEHQVDSKPQPSSQYFDGDGTTPFPLNRLLPPGSEADHAKWAAERRLVASYQPKKNTSWKMVGIRTEYQAGMWISKIKMYGTNPGSDYVIEAPIRTVLHDFLHQITVIGGLINAMPRLAVKGRPNNTAVPSSEFTPAKGGAAPTIVKDHHVPKKGEAGWVEDE